MIRIAYIFTPIEFGGSEKVNLTFLRNVNRSKFDIVPILLIRPWEKDSNLIKEIRKIKYSIHRIPVAKRPRNEGRNYLRIARCYKILYRILCNGSFDLIHSHGYFADILGVPIAKLLRTPILSTCHGFISNDRNLRIYNKLDKLSLRFANKVICVSESIKYDLIRNGIKETRIVVIPNAVETDMNGELFIKNRKEKRQSLDIKEDEFVLGYIGRLSEEKGINYLIESSSMLNNLNIPIKVVIIGQGPQKKILEDLAKEKGIESKVIFCGFQPDVENWLPAIDTFILPSLTEGTPMSLLEAMAYGIPAVASAVGGVSKLIDSGKNGIIVSPGKPEEIKDTVFNLYNNKKLRNSISMGAKQYVNKKHNIGDWTNKIEVEYLNIVKK